MPTLNCTQRNETTSLENRIFKASSMSLIFLVAVYLNAKTFYVILKQRRESRKAVTIFLLNMTFVSGLEALLLMPFNIHAIIETTWVFGEIFCQINGFTSVFLCADLIFTLLCMTIDRYLSVIKPLKHRLLMTKHTAHRMLLAVHLLSLSLALIPFISEANYEYHPGTHHCSPAWHKSCAAYFLLVLFGFFIPILGMLGTYSRIIAKVRTNRRLIQDWKSSSTDLPNHMVSRGMEMRDMNAYASRATNEISSRAFQSIEETSATETSFSRSTRRCSKISSAIHRIANRKRVPEEYRVARTSFILVLMFAILWAPYLVAYSCLIGRCRQSALFTVSMYSVYLNAVANPIIYALSNRTVQQGFRTQFRWLSFARTRGSERS